MCNKTDNSCREEKLGCKGCFYKEKGLIDIILNTDFLEDMCSEETANEYKKAIKEELKEIKQKAFEDGQESVVKRYISKDKLKDLKEFYITECKNKNITLIPVKNLFENINILLEDK